MKKLGQYGHSDMWLVMDRKLSDNVYNGKASPLIASIPLASSAFDVLKAIDEMAKKSPCKTLTLKGIRQMGDMPVFEVAFLYPATSARKSAAAARSANAKPTSARKSATAK